MAPDPRLAGIHFRVQMAGEAAEQAITALRSMRIFQARQLLQSVASHLETAAGYATGLSVNPQLAAYLSIQAKFYHAEAAKIRLPSSAPPIAAEVLANQGTLLAADPASGIPIPVTTP